ncbi:MAG: hypothetical protein KAT34_22525 [Candidatus Aminicenantes bacterium]|nr:hypothetical protein [Candidatus Aminicenantes bacterium]
MRQEKLTFIIVFLTFIVFSLVQPVSAEGQGTSTPKENLFSGLSLKFGWMTKPNVEGLGDKWIASIAFDKKIRPYLAWGLECQPYFRGYKGGDIKTSLIAGNVFLNAKGGYPIGKLINMKALWFLKPLKLYGGLGAGVELSNISVTIEGESYNDFNLHFAWHMIFGVEYALPKISFIVEYQPVRVIDKNLEPSTIKSSYLFLGIRLYNFKI